MSGGSKKQTIGYKYYLGAHIGLCHGPISAITEIQVDKRVAWEGISEGGTITISAPDLFGGDGREGGVSGLVDVEMGLPSQTANAYLSTTLYATSDIPAFKGVAAVVLNQCYVGNNPYLKPWKFKAARYDITSNGEEIWNSALAGIPQEGCDACGSIFNYLVTLGLSPGLSSTNSDLALNLTTTSDSTGGLDFPIDTGTWTVNTTLYDETADLFTPDISLGTPCNSGAWDVVYRADTYSEQQPPAALHLPGTDGASIDAWRFHVAFILKNDPNSVVFPVLGGSGNQLSPIYGPRNSDVRVYFDNGTSTVPQNSGSTGVSHYISIRKSETLTDVVDVLVTTQGSTTQSTLTDSIGSPVSQKVGEISIPESAWEDWLVLSVTLNPTFTPIWDGSPSGAIQIQMDVSGWVLDITYNSNPGGTPVPATVTVTGSDLPFNGDNITYFAQYNHAISGPSTRLITRLERTGGDEISLLDNTECYVAGIYTDAAHINSAQLYDAFTGTASSVDTCAFCQDMNPAHIIYETLTNGDWGMGYASTDIDEDSFTTAAETMFAESMGISILWEKEQAIEEFIEEILRHIDAVLYVSRQAGKFVLKLIRDDADSNTITLDETNVSEVANAKRPTVSELTNAVSVIYWNRDTDEDESLTIHNEALRQVQGVEISTTIQYPGFSRADIAGKVATRDLKALSTPLLSCDLTASRDAADLNVGDVFYLTWPDLNIDATLMRVNEIDYGDGINNAVSISAVEDVFSIPAVSSLTPTVETWIDPVAQTPLSAIARLVDETPYYPLVLETGELQVNDILADDASAGFILVSGGRQRNELNAGVFVDAGAGYVESNTVDFHPYAITSSDVNYTDTEILIASQKDIDLVAAGTIAQIGSEIVRVDSVNQDSSGDYVSVTLGRGVLDTVPAKHLSGAYIYFWGDFAVSDNEQYAAGESVSVKLRTVEGSSILPIADAPADSVTMNSRAIRPYPPGNLKIDGLSYPEPYTWTASHTLTWAHRDRLQQTDGNLYDYTDGSIGPEAGTAYVVEGFAVIGDSAEFDSISPYQEKFLEVNVGSDTTYTFDIDSGTFDSNYSEPPEGTTEIILSVRSVRDSYSSWQSPSLRLQYPGFTDSVGVDSVGLIDSVGIDSVGGDPTFGDTVLLLAMDGTNGSSTFTDDSLSAHTIALEGTPVLTTSVKKFGTAGGDLTGAGEALKTPTSADFTFGTGDFTVEMHVRPTGSNPAFIDNRLNTPATSFVLYDSDGGATITPTFFAAGSNRITGTINIITGTFYHLAVSRVSGVTRLFVDGVQSGSDYTDGNNYDGTDFVIGNNHVFSGGGLYLDNVRIKKGVGLYSAAFTPPSEAYPDF